MMLDVDNKQPTSCFLLEYVIVIQDFDVIDLWQLEEAAMEQSYHGPNL